MRTSTTWMAALMSFGAGWVGAHAAANRADEAAPGTYISASEVREAVGHLPPDPVGDAALRTLRIGHYNVSIAVVRRALVDGRLPTDAIVHDKVAEVYQISEGSGTLVTGGRLLDGKPLPANHPVVRHVAGPSAVGTRIDGGTAQHVGPGDLVVIPPNTPHGFVQLDGDRIVYTLVRIDAEGVLTVVPN
ncbi:MAG TPA: AraC family ligand binding domain-containing protein [Steroidobacteraceae bacterium]|nr:AraC family ligand binding domain-containing protein [Steroidobacteraceae bacterium]